jgi:hypothetical protein
MGDREGGEEKRRSQIELRAPVTGVNAWGVFFFFFFFGV